MYLRACERFCMTSRPTGPPNVGGTMNKIKVAIVSAIAAAAVVVPASAQAVTATVLNNIECSYKTGQCVQTNGAYNPTVGRHCTWVFRPIWGGNRSRSLCPLP
jgi:hypothetical protein